MARGFVRSKFESEYRVKLPGNVAKRRHLVEQLLLALEAKEEVPMKFKELADSWLKHIKPRRVQIENEQGAVRHLEPFWELSEGDITVGAVETFLALKREKYSVEHTNRMRSVGKLIVRWATGEGKWHGRNPFELAARVRGQVEPRPMLSIEQWCHGLKGCPLELQRFCLFGLCTAMRPGEIWALQKADVDTVAKTITVRRSRWRDETKTGRTRILPLSAFAWRILSGAMDASKHPQIFTWRGVPMTYHLRLSEHLKASFRGEKLDLKPEVRDTRVVACSQLLELKTPEWVVRRVMGHAAQSLTDGTYARLSLDTLREYLESLGSEVERHWTK